MTTSEDLTSHFYDWEHRGRGWFLYDKPVCLEPPFEPFFHQISQELYEDDGIAPSIIDHIIHFFSPQPKTKQAEHSQLTPFLFEEAFPLRSFQLHIPESTKVTVSATEQLLLMLSLSKYPISFEVIGTSESIKFQIVCRHPDHDFIQAQIKGFFPDIEFVDTTFDLTDTVLTNAYAYLNDLCLQEEFMRPLSMPGSIEPDTLIGITSIMETLLTGEQAIIQIQFSGTVNPWSESIIRSVTLSDGSSFFRDAPDMANLARQKVSTPLLAVSVRILGQSPDEYRAMSLTDSLTKAISVNSKSGFNQLTTINQPDYTFETRLDDFETRQSHKLGMLLNIREIIPILHLPTPSVQASKLRRTFQRTKKVPDVYLNNEFFLGINTHRDTDFEVSVTSSQRLKHTHIIGATGTGKSTFLINQIYQDMNLGNGLAVIDPHGDLIESILTRIPDNRYEDVIIIDPSDAEYPTGFNILSAHSDIEKEILASDLISVFRRLSTSWGDQMNSVFANAILAFLESSQKGTLVDLRRFLIEKDFRDQFLKTIKDPSIIYYWQKEYPLLKSTSIGPILTRLDAFLRPKVIRNMVAQEKSLDFENILDSGKILLVKLSQGLLGTENSYLLGSFFITKFYQAAMARQNKSKETRKDFFLYIDEFQNFITPSMSALLAGSRKYHVGLVLAHQDMQQVTKQDAELASALISNAGIRACFRLGDMEAKKFEEGFSYFEARDLQNLGTGQCICRIDRADHDFNMSIPILTELPKTDLEALKSISRNQYGIPRSEVEEKINSSLKGLNIGQEYISKYDSDKEPLNRKQSTLIVPKKHETVDQDLQSETTKNQLIQRKEISEHRYLQNLIKKMAESRGYIATIEYPLMDNSGLVDVCLEKNGKKIACEISITTKPTWELHNIEKCSRHGFDLIIVCSNNEKVLDKIRLLAQGKMDKEMFDKVFFMLPEQIFQFLDSEIAREASTETRTRGYRVQVNYNSISEEEMQRKKSVITNKLFGKKKEN